MNASINVNNITVTRLCYPSGEGSQEVRIVAPNDEMTALLVPAFVYNCLVTVEMFQEDRVMAIGNASFESESYLLCTHVLYSITVCLLAVCIAPCVPV